MSKRLIVLISVIVAGIVVGSAAFIIHRKNVISHTEFLLNRGKYQEVVEAILPKLEGGSGSAEERLLAAKAQYYLAQLDEALQTLQPLQRYGQENLSAVELSGWIHIKKTNPIAAQEKFSILRTKGNENLADGGMGAVALLQSEGYKKAELGEAELFLSKAVGQLPDHSQIVYYYTELKLANHDFPLAIESAEHLVSIAPYWPDAHLIRGRCYLLSGDYPKAESAFQESLTHGASEEDTKFYLAQSLYFQGRLQDSAEVMKEIAALQGTRAREAKENGAKIRLVLGQLQEAADLLTEVWKEKEAPQTGIQLYGVLTRLGKKEEATTLLKEMVSDRPFLSEAQLELGNLLIADAQYQPAYFAYQQVLDNDPSNFWAEYNLGCLAMARQDYAQAPGYFENCLQDHPNYFPAQINLAFTQFGAEEPSFTGPILQDLASLYPENPLIIQVKALEDFYAGDSAPAVAALRDALEKTPQDVRSLILLGEIELRLFQFANAKSRFEAALKVDPDNVRAKLGLAHTAYRIGNFEEATTYYSELENINPEKYATFVPQIKNGNALIALSQGNVSSALNQWDLLKSEKAFAHYLGLINATLVDPAHPTENETTQLEAALAEKKPLPEAYYNMALFLEKMGNPVDAVRQYEDLVTRYPAFLPGLYNLADLYAKRGQYDNASTYYEKCRLAAPERTDILNNEAAIAVQRRDFGKANSLIEKALAQNASSTTVRYNQALTALHEGNPQKTGVVLSQLESTGAPSSAVQMIQGLLLAQKKDWVQAADRFAQARAKQPMDPYPALNLGIALTNLEQYTQAEEALRDAISLDPSLAASHRALGMLYCKLGLYEEALDLLQSSLRLDANQEDVEQIVTQIEGWLNAN
ncbi:MAG: tetratricopeptide repeat protein [bacterium]|nr:tetratricopeptide repeat protein [bacterium]